MMDAIIRALVHAYTGRERFLINSQHLFAVQILNYLAYAYCNSYCCPVKKTTNLQRKIEVTRTAQYIENFKLRK